MKITLSQLVASRDAIIELLTLPLPSRIAFRMAKFQKQVEPETSAFDTARIKLLTPYAGKDGRVFLEKLPAADVLKINTELDDILQQEVDVEFDPLLSLEELTDFWEREGVGVKPSLLLSADFLFSDL